MSLNVTDLYHVYHYLQFYVACNIMSRKHVTILSHVTLVPTDRKSPVLVAGCYWLGAVQGTSPHLTHATTLTRHLQMGHTNHHQYRLYQPYLHTYICNIIKLHIYLQTMT